jgi:hypothetical protein
MEALWATACPPELIAELADLPPPLATMVRDYAIYRPCDSAITAVLKQALEVEGRAPIRIDLEKADDARRKGANGQRWLAARLGSERTDEDDEPQFASLVPKLEWNSLLLDGCRSLVVICFPQLVIGQSSGGSIDGLTLRLLVETVKKVTDFAQENLLRCELRLDAEGQVTCSIRTT